MDDRRPRNVLLPLTVRRACISTAIQFSPIPFTLIVLSCRQRVSWHPQLMVSAEANDVTCTSTGARARTRRNDLSSCRRYCNNCPPPLPMTPVIGLYAVNPRKRMHVFLSHFCLFHRCKQKKRFLMFFITV